MKDEVVWRMHPTAKPVSVDRHMFVSVEVSDERV